MDKVQLVFAVLGMAFAILGITKTLSDGFHQS